MSNETRRNTQKTVCILYLKCVSWAKSGQTKAHHAITSPTSPVPAGQSLVPLTFWPGASILQLGSGAVFWATERKLLDPCFFS